jgi:hypothetical protein
MATYKQIQTWVKQNHGFVPQTCWIADVKSQSGLAMGKAPNRRGVERARLCHRAIEGGVHSCSVEAFWDDLMANTGSDVSRTE